MDLNIFYREAGSPDSPTILFLHGFLLRRGMFQGLFPLLARSLYLIAPDYRVLGMAMRAGIDIQVYL